MHRLLGKNLVCDLGANEFVDLRRGIYFAVDPIVHVLAEPRLHHILHLHIEVVTLDHSL